MAIDLAIPLHDNALFSLVLLCAAAAFTLVSSSSVVVSPDDATGAAASCPVIEKNTCYPSSCDIVRLTGAPAASAGACCAACQANPKCVTFTLNFDGHPHAEEVLTHDFSQVTQESYCILKGCLNRKTHGNCTSGQTGRPIPNPKPGPPAPPPVPPPPPSNTTWCKKNKCRNVLYLLSDDMRADWHAYGLPVHTPNFDALAKDSLLFEHTYCQLSVCAPSRMSFMTGLRPDTNKIWNFIDTNPTSSLATPGWFRDYDYITLGLGKTFHQDSGAWNADAYWSLQDKPYYPYKAGKCPHGGEGGGHCIQNDEQIYDYHLRLAAVEYLEYAINKSKVENRPFYVMAGFRKPHAPWQAPQRMWDLYNTSDIVTAKYKTMPVNTDLIAWSNQLNVALANGTSFHYGPYDPVPDWVQQDQRHAYYASLSYVDENVGYILDVLRQHDILNDTLIIMHGKKKINVLFV